MNRKQRRAQMRAQKRQQKAPKPEYLKLTKEQRMDALVKNGITPKDLEQEYNKGFEVGFKAAGDSVLRSCYAAVCLALNDLHKFGSGRCAAVLRATEKHMLETLHSQDAIDEVYKRMKLRVDFKEAFDRIIELE